MRPHSGQSTRINRAHAPAWLLTLLFLAPAAPAQVMQRLEFTRMVAHWSDYGRPDYIDFINEAQPEIAQVGFYGAHFWSLVHTPQYGGYPAHFPVRGIKEASDWFADLNRKLHRADVKVIGH